MLCKYNTIVERKFKIHQLRQVTTSKIILLLIFTVLFFVIIAGCKPKLQSKETENTDLIVYCENGILGPVMEFVQAFEDSTHLNVSIQNDCARNLINLIHYRREADIFIPDSREAINNILLASPELILDSVYLGNQTLVFIIPRGNPSRLTGSLNSLTNPKNGIILANPESSTLGYTSGILLKKHKLYDQVMNSVLFLTTDSRSLIRDIASEQASIAIVWESDYLTNSIRKQVDTLAIQASFKSFQTLAVTLNSGNNKKNALQFLESLKQEESRKIFEKYGITKSL
ncbi:substrate-binding domain-containing protein [Marinilabilia sp.]|uniref:substrate-binding domain-containing protein n=1 Tax=Marinilabilia sp. TaxID=2021252 RepID=UPI0025BA186B|nr:substrate-binding domain-containing protein [Marinilabilia sp.]